MNFNITDVAVLSSSTGQAADSAERKSIVFLVGAHHKFCLLMVKEKRKWKKEKITHLRYQGKRRNCPYCGEVMLPLGECAVLKRHGDDILAAIFASPYRLRVMLALGGIDAGNYQ